MEPLPNSPNSHQLLLLTNVGQNANDVVVWLTKFILHQALITIVNFLVVRNYHSVSRPSICSRVDALVMRQLKWIDLK